MFNSRCWIGQIEWLCADQGCEWWLPCSALAVQQNAPNCPDLLCWIEYKQLFSNRVNALLVSEIPNDFKSSKRVIVVVLGSLVCFNFKLIFRSLVLLFLVLVNLNNVIKTMVVMQQCTAPRSRESFSFSTLGRQTRKCLNYCSTSGGSMVALAL